MQIAILSWQSYTVSQTCAMIRVQVWLFFLFVGDDLIRKNPFGFELASVVVNDSVTRETNSQKTASAMFR